MQTPEKLHILVAEYNDSDIALLKRIALSCDVECELYFARDGKEALDALAQRAKFEAMPMPDLMLVNIYLPKIDGLEVLRRVKEDERARRIPVVILTMSERQEDMVKAYDCGAVSYLLKPVEPEEFRRLTQTVHDYWQLVRKPSDSGAKRKATGP